jgi:acyl-coenzyme A synthetase/AMP-(fatty) acid ligase
VILVKELPRNTMGKVLKDEVKKFFVKRQRPDGGG